ncbi:MAG: hypothetical protein IJZ47_06855 [Oscillospiraceae bacterium]|nr:hypothetical protein [Oscillospiraceae bacterium]
MAMTEASALARVLDISHELYSALARGDQYDYIPLLDSISAALSHCGNDKKPLRKCMRALKRELRSGSKPFFSAVKQHFSFLCPTLDYDFSKATKHVPAIIYGNDMICSRLAAGETDKARSMADAMRSYRGFLYGEFEALTDMQFYELVFGYYPKLYDEPFMDEMKHLFNA